VKESYVVIHVGGEGVIGVVSLVSGHSASWCGRWLDESWWEVFDDFVNGVWGKVCGVTAVDYKEGVMVRIRIGFILEEWNTRFDVLSFED
jgi:hypothetical protein